MLLKCPGRIFASDVSAGLLAFHFSGYEKRPASFQRLVRVVRHKAAYFFNSVKSYFDTCKYKASDTATVRAVKVAGATCIGIATGRNKRTLVVEHVPDTGV